MILLLSANLLRAIIYWLGQEHSGNTFITPTEYVSIYSKIKCTCNITGLQLTIIFTDQYVKKLDKVEKLFIDSVFHLCYVVSSTSSGQNEKKSVQYVYR